MSRAREILLSRRVSAGRVRYEREQTRLGRASPVKAGWSEYDSSAEVERRAAEIHYDVLRREGFDADRAREIAASSADQQARLLERAREERTADLAVTHALGRSRFRTPHFGPYAGVLCRVNDDGSLTPVGDS